MKHGLFISLCLVCCFPACSFFQPKAERDIKRLERQLMQTTAKLEQIHDNVNKILDVVRGHESAIRNIELAIGIKKPMTATAPQKSSPAPKVAYPASGADEASERLYSSALAAFHQGDKTNARSLFYRFSQEFSSHSKAPYAVSWMRYIDKIDGQRARTDFAPKKIEESPVKKAPRIENPGQDTLYAEALAAFQRQRYAESISLFEIFLNQFPGHSLADNSLYWIGECQYAMKNYQVAIDTFKSLIAQSPQGNKHPDATLKAAFSYLMLQDTANADAYFKQVVELYPTTAAANVARRKLREIEQKKTPSHGSERLNSLQVYVKETPAN